MVLGWNKIVRARILGWPFSSIRFLFDKAMLILAIFPPIPANVCNVSDHSWFMKDQK
jgi:hypothetical protein